MSDAALFLMMFRLVLCREEFHWVGGRGGSSRRRGVEISYGVCKSWPGREMRASGRWGEII